MKPKLTFLTLALGVLAMSPDRASAQENRHENPPSQETIRPATPNGQPAGDAPHRERAERRGPADDAEGVPTPFIGVVTRELEPEVRSQTGLADGYGLLVVEIMPDGPAKEAGLQQHDVLVKFEDQKLINMEQLQVLVRSQKKGDEVSLTIRRGGAEQVVKLKIGERNMPPMREENRNRGFGFPLPRGGGFHFEPPQGMGRDELRERADHLRNDMRDYQRRLQDWFGGQKERPMPQFGGPDMPRRDGEPRRGPPPPPGGDRRGGPDGGPRQQSQQRTESSSSSRVESGNGGERRVTMHGNVIRTDDTGVYTIRRENDKTTFTVKTKDGKETSWPVNNDQDRQAVPQEYQTVLREMEKIQLDGRESSGRRGEQDSPPPAKPDSGRGGQPKPGGL